MEVAPQAGITSVKHVLSISESVPGTAGVLRESFFPGSLLPPPKDRMRVSSLMAEG